ncbi:hypothetical protein GGR52DRAFT_32742 [Hypoxylon sp. FL1284]|nr:hypothetical protein GGR52DRAFT_32742 [Hypoxylon sp. FL1284]
MYPSLPLSPCPAPSSAWYCPSAPAPSFQHSSVLNKFLAVRDWWRLPVVFWLVVAIYVNSWIFVFGSAIIDYGIGVDSSLAVCSAAILLCLFFYISTKILIYMLLVEKAFIIQRGTRRRLESKMYILNAFGILTIYGILYILSTVYRIARMERDQCIIGSEKQALVPLIIFEIFVNVYLTSSFLNPLQSMYLGKGLTRRPAKPPQLRSMGIRTFVGAVCTTTASVV